MNPKSTKTEVESEKQGEQFTYQHQFGAKIIVFCEYNKLQFFENWP